MYIILQFKREKSLIIPIGAEKAFNKMLQPSIIKTLNKLEMEENFCLIYIIHEKTRQLLKKKKKVLTFLIFRIKAA